MSAICQTWAYDPARPHSTFRPTKLPIFFIVDPLSIHPFLSRILILEKQILEWTVIGAWRITRTSGPEDGCVTRRCYRATGRA
ncbi:unnamed protein product [Allacma fusca]|uniref:Uncharacterized protein n=1 Tax=Allacma fusca TaxID=39272 RepID=A0A8J2KJH9_9HEXA|nr:unnamed protein product [Allacma fusca]